MQIAIDLIDQAVDDVRHAPAGALADEAMARSIRRYGILQAITVRPKVGRFEVVFGNRRLRMATTAGLIEVPVEVREMADDEARVARVTENLVRSQMHPVDQWRAARSMIDAGTDVAEAAIALGLDDRATQRMVRLGQLHPDLLKVIEVAQYLPNDSDLRAMANAPMKLQASALKACKQAINGPHVNWHVVAHHCKRPIVYRSAAIFDLGKSKIVWDEDLFAEPGSDEQFSTSNVEQFMKLQRLALEAQVAEAQKRRKRIRLAQFDKHGALKIPKGWRQVWGGNVDRPKAHEHVLLAIGPDGKVIKHLVLDAPSEKLALKAAEKKAKAASAKEAVSPTASMNDTGETPPCANVDGEQEVEGSAAAESSGRGPLTKPGLSAVAVAKTAALQAALHDVDRTRRPSVLLAVMTLAFAASNVEIRGIDYRQRRALTSLASRLLLPGGDLDAALQPDTICGVACELLGTVLRVSGPDASRYAPSAGSGDAAEWIGRALGADDLLPRFDTEEFLKHVAGSELKRLAGELGMRTTMKLDALRSALVGNAPNWRPSAAQFGAAAPVARDDVDTGDEDGDIDPSDELEAAA